jgi:nucleotide-binding universal stress UspA family protein
MDREFPAPFHIQLAVDGSDYAGVATRLVNDLPLRPHSQVTILGVVPPGQSRYESRLRGTLRQTEKALGRKAIETRTVLLYGHAAKQLIAYGSDDRPDLMVIGASEFYATLKILLGGVAHEVVEGARWPVLVARAPYHGLRRVLLATDGSQGGRLAAEYLAYFPLPEQTEIQVVHVQPLLAEAELAAFGMRPFGYGASWASPLMDAKATSDQAKLHEQKGRAILAETRRILETASHRLTSFIMDGDPASQILAYSQAREIDLIVAGSRGLRAVEGWWWGSVSRKLVRYSDSSMLFVRTEAEDQNLET